MPADYKPPTTTGWRPTCKCDANETVPCTVLDPFSGAATTGLVALKRGRSCVGLELNPVYQEMARKRLAPFASETEPTFQEPASSVEASP